MRMCDLGSDLCSSDLFDLFGLDYRDIAPLYEALLAEMEQPETVAGINFGMASLDSQRDYPPEDVNGIGPVYRISADMMCWWHPEIGRAHVCTPVTNAPLVCSLLFERKTTQLNK